MKIRRGVVLLSTLTAAVLVLGACSSDDDDESKSSTETTVKAPATTAPAASSQTIVAIAAGNPDFTTLVQAVQAAGLAETLSGPGPFTVFAPTNEAFAKLPAGTLDTLLKPENKDQLANILKYHVIPSEVLSTAIKPGSTKVKTVQGEELTVTSENGKVTITDAKGNTVNVVKVDIEGSNGVIHVIDGVLLPS